METNQQAIVLLLGAKSSINPLPAIPKELSSLKSTFESHRTESLPHYKIKYEPYFTQKHLKTWLDDFANHIAVLHFAGHSDQSNIQTDDGVVRAEDIAAHVNTWTRKPGLVFLNGCQNQSQAQTFLDAGVSAVVATQRAVDDKIAAKFAREYHSSLLAQNGDASLTAALEQAKAKLGFEQSETPRSLDVDEESPQVSSWNWNLFLKDSEQAPLSLRKLLTLNRPQYDANNELINPYQGLAAFQEEDKGFFFGRQQLTEQLITTLDETPFLALLGSSGSGKSSLINAGIIPELRLANDCLIFKTRPGNDPFAEIARCISQHLYPEKEQLSQRVRESKQLAADYQLHPENLSELLQVCLQESGKRRLVLFIDQFEELFTHSDSDASKAAVKQYETALAELVNNAAGSMTLVLTMRADFLGTALTHQTLGTLLDQYSQYNKYLSPMSSAELRSVILEPAAKQGVSIEDGLTGQLLDELKKNTESLPLLQHVLSLLWQSRDSSTLTLLDYTRLGGIETALETQADQFLDSLDSSEQKEQVKRIFLRLINLGEGQDDTRRRADMAEFGNDSGIETLIQQLAKQRLVATQGDDSHNSFVEISHETLIRSWGKLKEWINEDRDQLRIQHQVSKAAKDWVEHEYEDSWLLSGSRLAVADEWLKDNESIATESEKKLLRVSKAKEKKEKNRIISAVAVVIALLTIFAVFAGFQWDAARTNAKDARQKERRAVEEKLNANYNLAKAFEEKSLFSISRGDADPFSPTAKNEHRKSLLYALQAQILSYSKTNNTSILKVLGKASGLNDSILTTERFQTPYSNFGAIGPIVYSPNGNVIATGSSNNTIRLWDIQSGSALKPLKGHSSFITTIAYSPSGNVIVSGSRDNTIRLWSTQSGQTIKTLTGHTDDLRTVVYSPNGKIIASSSLDNTVRLWNAESGETIKTLSINSKDISALAFSPNGETIATGSSDKIIRLWNVQTGKPYKILKKGSEITALSFSPDGQLIASAFSDNTTQLISTKNFQALSILKGHSGRINTVVFSPSGKTIATGSSDKTIRLWDTLSNESIITLKGHTGPVSGLAYNPRGTNLVSGSMDDTIRLWNPFTGKVINTFVGHSTHVEQVLYSPDGNIVASSAGESIRLWNARTGAIANTLTGHSADVTMLHFSPNSKVIASSSKDGTIKLWNAESGKLINTLKEKSDGLTALAFSPDGNVVIASDKKDNKVKFWSIKSGKAFQILDLESPTKMTFSPDGKIVAIVVSRRTVHLWNIKSNKAIAVLKGHANIISRLAFSFDGKIIATASTEKNIRLWNAHTGEQIKIIESGGKYGFALAFSPNNETIASTSGDNSIQLVDIKSGKTINRLTGHSQTVLTLDYSPNGQMIVSGSFDHTIRFWDLQPKWSKNTLNGHLMRVIDISYHPKGEMMASASLGESSIRVWDTQSGKTLKILKGHTKDIHALTYSPNGEMIASLSVDGEIRLWDTKFKKATTIINDGLIRSGPSGALTFSPNGKIIASGFEGNIIKFWDTKTGRKLYTFKIPNLRNRKTIFPASIFALAYHPSGKVIASTSDDGIIRLLDAATGKTLKHLKGHKGVIWALAYSPDGSVIASGSADKTIRMWNSESGEIINTINESDVVLDVAYSPDGKFIASSTAGHTIRLWDAKTNSLLHTLMGHDAPVGTLAFHPTNNLIASGSWDKTIRLWRLNSNLFRFIYDFDALEVSKVLRFLWELEFEGLEIVNSPRPQSLFSQMGYHIAWTDETRKFRPLLDMPEGDDTKMDQVVKWLEKRCAYKQPERYNCTPAKETEIIPN